MPGSNRPNSRLKNRKIHSARFRKKGVTFNCHHEPTGIKILKLLSGPLNLEVIVWKNGRKVKEFKTDSTSKKINVEFRDKRWHLKDSKSQTSEDCLIHLFAELSNGDPKFMRKLVLYRLGPEIRIDECTWAAKRLVARNPCEAGHLIDQSQGIMCSDITVAWPRIGAEKPDDEVDIKSDYSDCVQIASSRIPKKRFFAFLSYGDQNYFLYKTLRKYEMQKALRTFCDLEWEELLLYIPVKWVFEVEPDFQCTTWEYGDRDSQDKIVALRFAVKHHMGSHPSDKTRLVIHSFVPIPEDDEEVLPGVHRPVIVGKSRPFRRLI